MKNSATVTKRSGGSRAQRRAALFIKPAVVLPIESGEDKIRRITGHINEVTVAAVRAQYEISDKPSLGEAVVGDLRLIDCNKIVPLPNQPRQYFQSKKMRETEASIREDGQYTPAVVVPAGNGMFKLNEGERRWRICTKLGRALLCIVRKPFANSELEFEASATANSHREPLTQLETALAMRRLKDGPLKRTNAELAVKFNCSVATVANNLMLLTHLDQRVLDFMNPALREEDDDRLLQGTVGLGLTIFKEHPEVQFEIAKHVFINKTPLREATRIINERADQMGITTGRGREQKPSDYLKTMTRLMRMMKTGLGFFVDMPDDKFFGKLPPNTHSVLLRGLLEVQRMISGLCKRLQTLEAAR